MWRNSILATLVVASLCLPSLAKGDYLYSVFRDECTADYTTRFSGADPIIATVHMDESEFNRVTSNYMTWGGFNLVSGSFRQVRLPNGETVKLFTKSKGLLYALRLFKETTANSNQWKFLEYNNATVLDQCDVTGTDRTFDGGDQACIFEAGSVLTARDKRNDMRRIYTGLMGDNLTPPAGSPGALTYPIVETIELPLDSGIPTTEPSTWSDLLNGVVTETHLAGSTGVQNVKRAWAAMASRLSGAMARDELPWNLGLTSSELSSPTNRRLARMLKWLHGEGAVREWDLGDVYHASTAVVEAPERLYRDRSYPYFKKIFEKRPEMIYVGANDGMIHAFHASPDIHRKKPDGSSCSARWLPGDEAWAYVPANMLAKTLAASRAGDQRFFSQDLSCRFTDVQIDTSITTCDDTTWKWPWELSASEQKKAYCGWRTVLLCGQGWGGSWYVALDVTDPLAPYRNSDGEVQCSASYSDPDHAAVRGLWEYTYEPTSDTDARMGKTWSLPFIGLVNFEGTPRWLAMMGSGYNSDMENCPNYTRSGNSGSCSGIDESDDDWEDRINYRSKKSFRLLNLDYDGEYPQHGNGISISRHGLEGAHAWVLDVATGEVLKTFSFAGQLAAVADIPAVDSDMNGLVDAAYVAGWKGTLARIYFGDKETSLSSIGNERPAGGLCPIVTMTGHRFLTSHPTAFGVPPRSSDSFRDRVMVVQGSGLNQGDDPDQQVNNGNYWDIDARFFTDDGSSTCPTTGSLVCDANNWWRVNANEGSQKPRLLGAPIFSRQANGDDWLVYTTWLPPSQTGGGNNSNVCAREGIAQLWCLDVTNTNACKACNGFEGNGNSYNITLYAGEQPPSAPVSADGNIYVSGEDGPLRQSILNSDKVGPNANSFAPVSAVQHRVISWREVF